MIKSITGVLIIDNDKHEVRFTTDESTYTLLVRNVPYVDFTSSIELELLCAQPIKPLAVGDYVAINGLASCNGVVAALYSNGYAEVQLSTSSRTVTIKQSDLVSVDKE